MNNCNNSSLGVFVPSDTNSWDIKKINHLFRRVAYGISPSDAIGLLDKNPAELVDELIDDAIVAPGFPVPSWADETAEKESGAQLNDRKKEWKKTFIKELLQNEFRNRLTFFWSNHLVASMQGHQCVANFYKYSKTLQVNALGNFKTFVFEIGLDNLMLNYLNGRQNTKNKPNENYARELYELFTLGEGNDYTQQDIVETARALTGYNNRTSLCSPITFARNKFDAGAKTIFGKTGDWGYADVITILFEERAVQISQLIAKKIYMYYVHPELPEDATIIDELALTLRTNNFEIVPMLRRLLKSEHFFNKDAMDVIIKSPVDLMLSFYRDAQLIFPDDDDTNKLINWSKALGQSIYEPPNVAGWQRDKDWISSPTLILRWNYMKTIINNQFNTDKEQFRILAYTIAGISNDVEVISKAIVNWFLPEELLSDLDYSIALDTFKIDSIPENYYEDGTWDLLTFNQVPKQVRELLKHIVQQPEFQLK